MKGISNTEAFKFFDRYSASHRLFIWLSFCRFVERSDALTPKPGVPLPQSLFQWLNLWEKEQGRGQEGQRERTVKIPWWLYSVCFLVGGLTMLGVLMAHTGTAINIWAPLFLFAFLPFLLSLFTGCFAIFSTAEGRQKPPGYDFLAQRFDLPSFDKHRLVLQPWLSWQIQRGAALAVLGGLLSFFVFATFQEVQFYWSSTFISNSETMVKVFHWIALPWQALAEAPSLDLVQASQNRMSEIGGHGSIVSGQSSSLWQFVVLSVLFYGLLPRLVLTQFFRWQLTLRLKQTIEVSSLFEQFLNRQQQTISIDPLLDDVTESASKSPVSLDPSLSSDQTHSFNPDLSGESTLDKSTLVKSAVSENTGYLIGWRLSDFEREIKGEGISGFLKKNLGVGSWQSEEDWLQSTDFPLGETVYLLAEEWQTPTGELADVLDILKERDITVSLFILTDKKMSDRSDVMSKTWLFFAKQHQVELQRGRL